ncbi:MAG: hypothetical protein GY757_40975 [bacterium]|nr:hypothetical protein [bacterium]
MNREELLEKVKQFGVKACIEFPVKKVILFGAWLEGIAKDNDEIEVAIVLDRLREEDDYVLAKFKLEELAAEVDHRIEPVIIETAKGDIVGFYKEVMDNGQIVLEI